MVNLYFPYNQKVPFGTRPHKVLPCQSRIPSLKMPLARINVLAVLVNASFDRLTVFSVAFVAHHATKPFRRDAFTFALAISSAS